MQVLLIIYGVFLLVLTAFGGAGLYHAYKFGYQGDKSRLGAFIYITVIAIILIASFILIGATDFSGEEI